MRSIGNCTLYHGDCLEVMPTLPDNSVDAIITDPPYFKVKKNEPWDNQWKDQRKFLEWFSLLVNEWHRLLKPNGSIYVFAAPRVAAKVELAIAEKFCVLTHIVWRKSFSWHGAGGEFTPARCSPESLRTYYDQSERIIFAEHYNADNIAKGEAGYLAKCDELRGFVFEPLRAYLDGERRRAGLSNNDVNRALGTATNGSGMAGHYFKPSGLVQWALPTELYYTRLRNSFPGYFLREYEDLRREYEDLRRPFAVTSDVPYTDVWDFKAVAPYPGKHPCEKPLPMLEHMLKASTRPGAVVLDSFMGSGSLGEACERLGRRFIGIEQDAKWFERASHRVRCNQASLFDVAGMA